MQRLEGGFGSLEEAWQAPPRAIGDLLGWSPRLQAGWLRYRERWGDDPMAAFRSPPRADLGVLLPGDPAWPPGFSHLARPPLALYWRGRGSLWPALGRRQAVAVLGTRRPSRQGLAMAERLGVELARAGWPVVSGLAEGIDAAAHQGCLARQGVPVGVLGTPLERVYPRHHTALQRQVGHCGLLMSEQPSGTVVHPAHFACRNRLQVALARAVVVVECPAASGALHSAALAWQQGLPLWVVPADVDRLSAAGSNRLLAQGATPLLAPHDLTTQLGPGPLARPSQPRASPAAAPHAGQPRLLIALGQGASLEQLAQRLGLPPDHLLPQLLELELAGLVIAEPGLCWRPR
ncbi:MAG: DNA-processing protein DprA [Synechococcaceae cyanobacterium]|nr:DNA-processing protein DprA [Synechococcaceae cyanobacterium]